MENKFDISNFLRCQMQLADAYKKRFSSAAAECNITKPEADVMVFLANNPQLNTARDIAEYRGFSKAYVSKAVELLLAKELICIRPREKDRRYQYLEICPKAAQTVKLLKKAQGEFVEKIIDTIGKPDSECFTRITQKLLKNMPE